MFRRKIPIKKYFALTSMLVLMGFFACVLHITPQSLHHVVDTHAEHSNNQVVCVDHQVSTLSCSKDQGNVLLVATIPPSRIEIVPITSAAVISDNYIASYDPPNKIPLYIKNNILLI